MQLVLPSCLGACLQETTPVASGVVVLVVLFLVVNYIQERHVVYHLKLWWECLCPVPTMEIPLSEELASDNGIKSVPVDKIPPLNSVPGYIQCYDPSTNQFLGQVPAMTPAQVHEACQKAAAAQKEWSKTSFAERRRVLRTLQKYICAHVHDICRVSSRDSGKPQVDALLGEVLTTTEKIRTIVQYGELWLQPSYRPVGPLMMHKTAVVEYVPLGVIATIAPWNYPFHNLMNHIISGIFAGNAVVGKVSEYTSWSAVLYFSKMAQEALIVNGHNPDLVQTITGFGDAGAALVEDPLTDKIIFTGSPAIGRKVMETASRHLKPVILELGGKDAMVFMDDCKLKDVLPWVMRGCFQNCGQNCVGIERVFVYESLYEEFLDAALQKVKNLRQGIPLETCGSTADIDCGSMVMAAQLDLIQALVDDAIKKGARVLIGGHHRNNMKGQFYEPTIVADVTPEMRIFQEELFGPVMSVIKVPKDSDEECLKMVNNSAFGLGSYVYSSDQKRGLRLARQFRTGMCCVNDFGSNYLVQSLPFGGVKESGFGRFGGIEGLQALCLERSILTDRIPGIKTTIPGTLDYPIDKKKGLPFAESLIQFFYNESIIGKIKGIVGLIKYG